MTESLGLPPAPKIPSKLPPAMSESELEHLEGIVEAGKRQFVNVGYALLQIRDKRGYKLRGFDTFEDYCDKQFGISRRQGYRLMDAATLIQGVTLELGAGDSVTQWVTNAIPNERQARDLKEIGEPAVVQTLKTALASPNPVAAAKQAVSDLLHGHREEKAKQAELLPRYEPHEDSAPGDDDFEKAVAQEATRKAKARTAEENFIRCPLCGTMQWLDRAAHIVRFQARGKGAQHG